MGGITPQYREMLNKRYRRRKQLIDNYKAKKGCSTCGYKEHNSALQWAHIEPVHNGLRYQQSIRSGAIKTIFKELRKCKVLCANCHAIETYNDKLLLMRWN